MPCDFASLPTELLLQIAESADERSLCSLIRTVKSLHFLLWPVLYRRELSRRHPVGLIRCIRRGSATAVSKFIAAGADINAKIETGDCEDFTGYTYPLATAVVRDQKEIVDLLLQHGADVNARIDGFLCYAVLADRVHPWAGVLSNTPLTVAVAMGHIDIAVELARKLADPDPVVSIMLMTDYTALEQAAKCLRPTVVRQLLERGANPNKRRPRNEVTLLHALLQDPDLDRYIGTMEDGQALFAEIVKTLLEYGADPFIKRVCQEHADDLAGSKKCKLGCNLTACSIGADSPYPQVKQHFRALGHRQLCQTLACRGSRHRYAAMAEDIPGHCHVA
jgi:ankyrin repeat protein